MTDIALPSRLLSRDVNVRVVAPASVPDGVSLPVVYVLHGAGEDFRTWTDNTPIAELATHGVILVMPDGLGTYYVNDKTGHRYEDFFITELMPAIDRQFPFAARGRSQTAIVGNSRGGFAASVYALKHPELFSYVAGLSSAYDLAERRFRWREPMDSWHYRKVWGPVGSPTRALNDPYLLARGIVPERAPYFDLLCGDRDSLLPTSERFAAVLESRNLPHRWAIVPGNHNWATWNTQLPGLEERLLAHFGIASGPAEMSTGSATTPAGQR